MSINYKKPSSRSSRKRRRETTTSTPLFNSKCGEIFVTPDWNKWTYNCTFCQLTTGDIGVFICHIRLQHSYFECKSNENAKNNSSQKQQQQQQHSNDQHDSNEVDSSADPSCSSMQDVIIKEDVDMIDPIEITPHVSLMTDEDQDFLDEQQNNLQTSTNETKLPTEMDNGETKVFNLDTLVVRNCDEGGRIKEKEEGMGKEKRQDQEKVVGGDKSNNRKMKSMLYLNTNWIKEQLESGTYKIDMNVGRSRVWDIFGKIIHNDGETLKDIVACTKCYSVHKYDGRTTSNLWRHKCVKEIEYI